MTIRCLADDTLNVHPYHDHTQDFCDFPLASVSANITATLVSLLGNTYGYIPDVRRLGLVDWTEAEQIVAFVVD